MNLCLQFLFTFQPNHKDPPPKEENEEQPPEEENWMIVFIECAHYFRLSFYVIFMNHVDYVRNKSVIGY